MLSTHTHEPSLCRVRDSMRIESLGGFRGQLVELSVDGVVVVGMAEIRTQQTDQLVRFEPEHLRDGRAHPGDPAARVHDLHHVGRVLHEGPEAFLTRQQLILRGTPLGDVAEVEDHATDAGRGQVVGGRRFDPTPRTVGVTAAHLVDERLSRK